MNKRIYSIALLCFVILILSGANSFGANFEYNIYIPYDADKAEAATVYINITDYEVNIEDIIGIEILPEPAQCNGFALLDSNGYRFVALNLGGKVAGTKTISKVILKTKNKEVMVPIEGKITVDGVKNYNDDFLYPIAHGYGENEFVITYRNISDKPLTFLEVNVGSIGFVK